MRAFFRTGGTAAVLLLAMGTAPAVRAAPIAGELLVKELGTDAGLRIRVFTDPDFFPVPASTGHLVLVAADSSFGKNAFFIPTDLAFELGNRQVYRTEFEQCSDLFGQALGGRLRPGETQVGFIIVPPAVDLDAYLPDRPDSVVMRYANRRASLHAATPEDVAWWKEAVPQKVLAVGLDQWWSWVRVIDEEAPAMSEGDRRFFAERIFPGQGHILREEHISAEALRNAILRVGERRLLDSRSVQRVAPRYPVAVRQAGLGGLVIALCYIDAEGKVQDAQLLASNTVHLLNLYALAAAMDWRFQRTNGPDGKPADGWRLLPFQFRIGESTALGKEETGDYVPPRVARAGQLDYPFDAKREKIKGTVVYRVTVDARGKLKQAVMVESVNPLLDHAALESIEKTLFYPATRNGKPVEGDLLMPFKFDKELD